MKGILNIQLVVVMINIIYITGILQQGACIVSAEDNRVISVGFSGFPDSINRKAVQTIRDTKTQTVRDTNTQTVCDTNTQTVCDINTQTICDTNTQTVHDTNTQIAHDNTNVGDPNSK